jgi:hypothetical protein
MKLAFILLAHDAPDALRPLILSLLKSGSDIFIHYDASSPHDLKKEVENWHIDPSYGKIYFAERISVAWGEWSIVQATLNCLELAIMHKEIDYFYLISGSCFPIKPYESLEYFLQNLNGDIIEGVNSLEVNWVKGGLQNERWQYRFFFNWRQQRKRFELFLNIQQKLHLKRRMPNGLIPYIGSQWWCLRSSTVNTVMNYIKENQNILDFYKISLIPDESFFQTLIYNLIPKSELSSELMLGYTFNYAGVPKIYFKDNLPELFHDKKYDKKFFIRKVSHQHGELKEILSEVFEMTTDKFNSFKIPYKTDYLAYFEDFKKGLNAKWSSLLQYDISDHAFMKRIPQRITIICSYMKDVREKALESYASDSSLVMGDLFCKNQSESSCVQARYSPGRYMAEIAKETKKNHIIFTMGNEAKQYLDYFKWSLNVKIIYIDSPSSLIAPHKIDIDTLKDIYQFKSEIYEIMENRYCEFIDNTSIFENGIKHN